MSEVVIDVPKKDDRYSQIVKSVVGLVSKIDTEPTGLIEQRVIIQTGNLTFDNREFDCEFSIPFDDDTEANEAEIVIYNLRDVTINQITSNTKITVTAGYGEDVGIIFSGFVSYRKTTFDGCDKKTTIFALDDMNLKERDVQSISYSENTTASYILYDLCQRVGLPIGVFDVVRNHTYSDSVTVDGGLMENIKKYAKVCGVSAYICKSCIYVRSIKNGDNTDCTLTSKTGLLSVSKFEEEETNEIYNDKIIGYEVEMLLQHKIQTASFIRIISNECNGNYRVREGSHEYDGENFITKVKVV